MLLLPRRTTNNTVNCQEIWEKPSQAQCPGRKQDFQDECDGLVTKANIRRNTSSCNTDPAKLPDRNSSSWTWQPGAERRSLQHGSNRGNREELKDSMAGSEQRKCGKIQNGEVGLSEASSVGWAPQAPGKAGWKCADSTPDLVTPNFSRSCWLLSEAKWRHSRDSFTSNQATWSDRYSSTFNYNPTKYFNSHLFHSILDNTQRNQLEMNHQLHGKLSSQVSWAYVHPGPSPASSNSQGTFYWAISQCQFPCLMMAIQQEMRQSLMSPLQAFRSSSGICH